MSQEIKNRLEEYIRQQQALISQLHQLKTKRTDVRAEASKTLISEGAAAVAADLFESLTAGRIGRKLTKTFLDQEQKRHLTIQERSTESQHNHIVRNVRLFLSSISVKRKNLKEPNSSRLMAKIDRAQEYMRIETRIRRTVLALQSIVKKPLIYNKDIPAPLPKEVIVPPGKPFTGSMKLKEILRNSQGYVNIIDPYVDETTLEFLLSIPDDMQIKLLTANTGGNAKERRLKRACKRFKVERPNFEIRKCEPRLIHDRFILTQTRGWSIGSSLKDIGKKMSAITQLSTQTKNEVEKVFKSIWNKSNSLIG